MTRWGAPGFATAVCALVYYTTNTLYERSGEIVYTRGAGSREEYRSLEIRLPSLLFSPFVGVPEGQLTCEPFGPGFFNRALPGGLMKRAYHLPALALFFVLSCLLP